MEIIFQGIGVLVLALIAYLSHKYMQTPPQEMEYLPLTPPVEPKIPPTEPLPSKSIDMPPTNSKFKPTIVKWAKAITQWEAALPASNNPGNMKYSSLTASWGATKGRPGADGGFFCQFKTPQAGMDALCNFLTLGAEYQLIISHPKPCTLDAFTTRFAGNPPQGYKDGIAHMLGVPLTVDIASLLV